MSKATCLSLRSRRLAFLAPCSGQWVFYSLAPPDFSSVLYNRQPAPPRCLVKVGDLLSFDGLELLVDAVVADPSERTGAGDHLPRCEIEVPGQKLFPVTEDAWIGWDARGTLSVGSTLGPQMQAVLLMFLAGRWYLHDLQGNALVRNDARTSSSLVLSDDDRIALGSQVACFHLHRAIESSTSQPAGEGALSVPGSEVDGLAHRCRAFWQQLLAVLHGEQKRLPSRTGILRAIGVWLRLLWPARSPEETLDRLELLLSGAPRDRRWLFELARFFYQRSCWDLCLQVLKELYRLYPHDREVVQTWVKLCYQQGRSAELPPLRRLAALNRAEKGTVLARRWSPDNPVLADLLRAVRAERTSLQEQVAQRTCSLHQEITRALPHLP